MIRYWGSSVALCAVLALGCDEPVRETSAAACDDGRDNDGDGLTDCDDAECVAHAFCSGAIDGGQSDAGAMCPAGLTDCAGSCRELARDREHCGGCGDRCASGEVCVDGACSLSCPDGLLACDGTCVDPLTNRTHCGAVGDCTGTDAGEACAGGYVCNGAGACALSCQSGLIICDDRCVDPLTDRRHCGASDDCAGGNAGAECATGHVCDGTGTCALSCQAGLVNCGGTCIDPSTDERYCGASGDCAAENAGVACGARSACSSGSCVCVEGLSACGSECVDPLTDERYCGAAGDCSGAVSCGMGEVCSAGACTCAPGLVRCGGSCIDPATHESYCGASGDCAGASAGTACGAGELCETGACVCAPGLVRCGSECVDPDTDERYCGAAPGCSGGVACGDGEACASGSCACAPGLVGCGGECIDPRFDGRYCGASGSCTGAAAGDSCAAGEVCNGAGVCVLSCPSTLTECASSCVDTDTAPSHCGSCGNACPAPTGAWPVCVAGVCSFACQPGHADCNGDGSDGCEADLSTDGANCGACASVCAGMCSAGACLCSTTTIASETFEATAVGARPSGWMDGCMGGTTYDWRVGSTARFGSRALTVDFRGSGGEAALGIPVAWPSSGTVEVSFWVRPETTTQNIYVLPVRGDQRLVNAVPFQRTGELGRAGSGVTYSAGTWYHVVYELDFDASSYRILLDDLVYDTGSLISAPVPCSLSGGDYLSFHGGYVDQKYLAYVDDVTVVHRSSVCGPSVSSHALRFDGDGDEVEMPMSFGDVGTRFTFEAWVRPTSASAGSSEGEGGLIFSHRASCTDFDLEWSGDGGGRNPQRFRFRAYPEATCSWVVAEASSTSVVGAWHHVAGVFDDGAMRLYVDGVLAGSAFQPASISWTANLLGHWAGRDGADSRPTRAGFVGDIDELRVSRVARYSGASFTPPDHFANDPDTVGVWSFDEGAGATAADGSSAGLDGIVRNARWLVSDR